MEVAKILFREDKSLFRETRVVSFELKEGGGEGGRELYIFNLLIYFIFSLTL